MTWLKAVLIVVSCACGGFFLGVFGAAIVTKRLLDETIG